MESGCCTNRPFLTVITRTYRRPNLLGQNKKSLEEQSCQDFEQIIVEDDVGIGIPATYLRLRSQEANGDYVWLFDDDNVLWDKDFVKKAKALAEQKPDVILCQARLAQGVFPDVWPPICGRIDAMNYIVSRKMWYEHRRDFGERYEGDFDFISSVAASNPKVLWMEGIIGGTQRPWKRHAEYLDEGTRIRIKESCAGPKVSFSQNEIVTVTKENSDILESLVRGGIAEEVDPPKDHRPVENIESGLRILVFCPTAPRLEIETIDAIFGQKGIRFFDVMFTRDNPHFGNWKEGYKNIQINYEKMRRIVLSEKYDAVWIVESDVIPPEDALLKLLEIDAPVVSGIYVMRHGDPSPNLMRKEASLGLGSGMRWEELQNSKEKVIEVSGGCMGCLLIRPGVLDNFHFVLDDRCAPDVPFMRYCWENKIKQVARLDVLCGHKKPSGEILWPPLNGKQT
jgi:hypothetical protein